MEPPSYMRFVVDRNVVMRRIPYSSVTAPPWEWQVIAETRSRVQAYVQLTILLCGHVGVCKTEIFTLWLHEQMDSHPYTPHCLSHLGKIRYRKSYAVSPISCELCENPCCDSHTAICRQPQLQFMTRIILVMSGDHEAAQAVVSSLVLPLT
jgi:hypothetical protein